MPGKTEIISLNKDNTVKSVNTREKVLPSVIDKLAKTRYVYNRRFKSRNNSTYEGSTYQQDFRRPVELHQKFMRAESNLNTI